MPGLGIPQSPGIPTRSSWGSAWEGERSRVESASVVAASVLGRRPCRSPSPGQRPGWGVRQNGGTRPNGPMVRQRRAVGPLGRQCVIAAPAPQGGALGWENDAPSEHAPAKFRNRSGQQKRAGAESSFLGTAQNPREESMDLKLRSVVGPAGCYRASSVKCQDLPQFSGSRHIVPLCQISISHMLIPGMNVLHATRDKALCASP